MRFIILFVWIVYSTCAASRYVSPLATDGTGTINDPWNIYTGIASAGSNDTIYLRDGIYYVSSLISTMNGVTMMSYPGEWAKIVSGLGGTLETTMSSGGGSSTILIQGSEHFQPTMIISIDNEQCQLSTTSGNATNWIVNRAWNGTTQTSHSIGAAVWLYSQMAIDHTGTNTVFKSFEVTSLMTTNRVGTLNFYAGGGINLHGANNKVLNCIIHNTGHPAIGLWDNKIGAEINGNIIWGNGIFDVNFGGVGADRGTGLYAQNSDGTALIKHNISFRNYTSGLHGFGETGPVINFLFWENICFQAGPSDVPLSVLSGSSTMTNNAMMTNYVMGDSIHLYPITMQYVTYTNQIGKQVGNVIVNGGLGMKEWISGYCSNNTCFIPAAFAVSDNAVVDFDVANTANKSELNFNWDYNIYYATNIQHPHQFGYRTKDIAGIASDGSGSILWSNDFGKSWLEYSGFDMHSTYATNWPNNYLLVRALSLDYDVNRNYVVVINTSSATNAILDLSTNRFNNGDRWRLRDAQNYFNVISSGIYAGGTINLPLNLTNIAQLHGNVTNFIPQHTNIQYPGLFNIFVLDRFSTLNFGGLSKLSGVTIQ